VEQSWYNRPNPTVTPGGAGLYQGYIQPYVGRNADGDYLYPPAEAIVEPGNPIGGKFTLPQSFIDTSGTWTRTPKTGWGGYTTIFYSVYYNGPGVFGANHGATGPTRVVFPTTGGNLYPNYASGDPVTPTTTFNGRYDFYRVGWIDVTPGPRRFGGTMRIFYQPQANLYQYIYLFSPTFYKAYGQFSCIDEGVTCSPSNFESGIGDITVRYGLTRFLLNVKGTGTGGRLQSNTAKATTPRTAFGQAPTSGGAGTPTGAGPASYITGKQQFVNTIHPWTTGYAYVHNHVGSTPYVITPHAKGYDISLGGADITVTRTGRIQNWNETLQTLTTTTTTLTEKLFGVGRIVSMVRPRIIHSYLVPLDWPTAPIIMIRSAARLWAMKVFFVPEPTGMLLLGAGGAALLGLSRMRRR